MKEDLADLKRYTIVLIQNPVALFVLSTSFSIGIIFVSKSYVEPISNVWNQILETAATAILTFGTFGVWFNFTGKKKLINEVVHGAIGQTRSIDLGIIDVKQTINEIDYREDIRTSSMLIACSRRSSLFLMKHSEEIKYRLNNKKPVKFITMNDAGCLPRGQGAEHPPELFFSNLARHNARIPQYAKVYKTTSTLCYNFVHTDKGIWIKLYFNAEQSDLPPAFFVKHDSSLYKSFEKDISLLFSNAQEVKYVV